MRRGRVPCGSSPSAAVPTGPRVSVLSKQRSKALRRNSCSNIAGADTRSSCRWSANSRSRVRWSPQGSPLAAAANADEVIVTDDNPRSENPQNIRAAILAEAKGATDIGDRAEAIRAGIAALQPGDALLIAGKGHETGQIVGDKVLPFSDHEAVTAALAARVA